MKNDAANPSKTKPDLTLRISEHPILAYPSLPDIPFKFNGNPLMAINGEMISSALIANGISAFNRHHRDGAPQGIFCANGQCAQCLVLANGRPVKACVTPVKKGMDVRFLDGLPDLPADDAEPGPANIETVGVDVLVIGGGPAGMMAAVELGRAGVDVLVVDDKQELGGKLGLQTHNFFGSKRDCYAGMRGMDIGTMLAAQVGTLKNVEVWLDSPAVGAFEDGLVGVVKGGVFRLVRPKRLLVTAGAREKVLTFPGCDLPGVYGGGAFQTLVNRDMVKAAKRLFIVGGGNVGLIAAYHAIQAGIEVVGIVEALPQCGGYKVHLDKIKRLGIPVWTSSTVLKAEGDCKLARITTAKVDSSFKPIAGTERSFDVDTLLIAVGLTPVNEILAQARTFGFKTFAAGDADIIAEASAAMFSGRIAGRQILRDIGRDAAIPKEWLDTLALLRAKPGPTHELAAKRSDGSVYPVIRCVQEIPCNPCTAVCPVNSIKTSDGTMSALPSFSNICLGCTRCVAICPGLAITLVDRGYDPAGERALVYIPWELPAGSLKPGDSVTTVGLEGESIGNGKVVAMKGSAWQNRRHIAAIDVPARDADMVAGIRLFNDPAQVPGKMPEPSDDGATIICRCERVTKEEIESYVRETGVRDFNALKAALRVGMGPCGGKTCSDHVMRLFKQVLGRDAVIEKHVERPFTQEVPMSAFLGGDEQ
ncbi:MAG: FAD-dependent oxidoreductase [Methanobacteriota archaeon]